MQIIDRHTVILQELNSNFGFNLPWWDRIFGTYRAQPDEGHEDMVIGIDTFRDPAHCVRLRGMLGLPFIDDSEKAPAEPDDTGDNEDEEDGSRQG